MPLTTDNFDRMDEIQRFFMNPALCHAGSRIHKISSTLSKVLGNGGGGGGGGGTPPPPFILYNCVSPLTLASTTMCFASVLL